ncbi:MAG: GspE/PulE family protein [Burkholderiales bacterium]
MGSNDERPIRDTAFVVGDRAALTISERVVSPEQLRQQLRRGGAASTLKLGARLLELGLVTQDQLNAALQMKSADSKRHLGEILLDLGVVSRTHLQQVLCEKLGIPLIDLGEFQIDEAVLRLLPQHLVRESQVLPVCRLDGKLVVAVADPLDSQPLDRVRFYVQAPILPVMAAREQIAQEIANRYGAAAHRDTASAEPDISVVALVNKILTEACASGATDIHIDASLGSDEVTVRLRRGGRLAEYARLPAHLRSGVVNRMKAMAGLDVSDCHRAQEGRIDTLEHGPQGLRLHVITVPTRGGSEHVAIKLMLEREVPALEHLGMRKAMLDTVKQLVAKPHGLLLVAAPAGGGKTTTAHALLSLMDAPGLKIWTAESPVEIQRPGLSQVEVSEKGGWNFAAAVRTIVNADPDVLLVGEIRERETAALALEASLRGSRILATVRANNAAEALARLLDMGVDAFSLSDALLGVVGQRLARRLCLKCRIGRALTLPEIEMLSGEYCYGTQLVPAQVRSEWAVRYSRELKEYRSEGCEACGGTGYQGRIGLYELLSSGPAIRPLLIARRPVAELMGAAVRGGMRTTKQDGIEKALAGHCDMREVHAATV